MVNLLKRTVNFLVSASLLTAIFWNQPVYKYYKLDGKGHLKNLKIVFLSDLHNTIYGRKQSKLLEMIDSEAPDLILAGGDMADEKTSIKGSKLLFAGLKDKYPVYYVSGNHEHWMFDSEGVFDMLQENGAVRLDNESVILDIHGERITLTGVNDPDATLWQSAKASLTKSLGDATEDLIPEGYHILLSHRPEHIGLYESYGFDLVLSGHAHGGQLRIPYLLNGLYSPNQGFFPKHAGGLYRKSNGMDFIIGRGLSLKKYLPRICNPPELIVITFE